MVEEHSGPPKRVVKKVVKRTVASPTQERPLRAARLTTRTRPEVTRRAAPPVPPRKSRPEAPKPKPAAAPKGHKRSFKPSMPSVRRPSMPRPDVRGRVGGARNRVTDAFHAVVDWFVLGFRRIQDAIADGWHWFTGLRLPHLSPLKGSAITGAVVGFMAVGLGWCFYQLFSLTLGAQAGGGLRFLALVFVAFLGFITGELLLGGFGVPHGRAISILSILLVFIAILLFFLVPVDGVWAFLIVPTLSTVGYVASCAMMLLAGTQTNDQRIPWEPTDDSSVT